MKIHCHRPSLAAAFQIVSGVVPSRTTRDILKNVKLSVSGGKATLVGTDSEVGIRHEIPGVETERDGETLLPTSRVISVLRELADEHVDLEVTDEAVWIRGAHSEFRLSAESAAEFPAVAAFDEDKYYAVVGKELREAIRRTIFATDVESTRYALGGVQLEPEAERISLAATDSRRLAVVKLGCRSQGIGSSEAPKPVIPSKAMSLIERSILSDDDDVLIAVHANEAIVKCGGSTISSRLVEGRFPKYRDVIPAEAKVSIEFVVGPLHTAVRQAQIVTNEESRGVDFTFDDGTLTLDSQAADIGQSKVQLPISYEGGRLTVTFDPRFVAEFLRVLDPQSQVRLDLIDAESAAVFRAGDAYTYVIMPLSRDR